MFYFLFIGFDPDDILDIGFDLDDILDFIFDNFLNIFLFSYISFSLDYIFNLIHDDFLDFILDVGFNLDDILDFGFDLDFIFDIILLHQHPSLADLSCLGEERPNTRGPANS